MTHVLFRFNEYLWKTIDNLQNQLYIWQYVCVHIYVFAIVARTFGAMEMKCGTEMGFTWRRLKQTFGTPPTPHPRGSPPPKQCVFGETL